MWGQIVAAFAILIAASYVVEKIFFRNRTRAARPKNYLSRDVAPLIAFAGILLIVLSFVEALRRVALEPWLLGIAFGVIVCAIALAAGILRQDVSVRGAFSWLRAYGIALFFALIGIYLAVRVIGTLLQVFVEGAFSIFVIGIALALFARTRAREHDQPTENKLR